MQSVDIIDISMFRLRIGANLSRSDLHQVSPTDGLEFDASKWSTIPDAIEATTEIHVQRIIFNGKFEQRNPLNIPGPFYGAETDTCETGPLEAPENVMLDGVGQEFVFRQPRTAEELRRIISAARCDPFMGYGADGDQHWNLENIREWWRGDKLAAKFLYSQSEDYLRRYAFFVDNRRLPDQTELLPDL